jgi:hypothetical protein
MKKIFICLMIFISLNSIAQNILNFNNLNKSTFKSYDAYITEYGDTIHIGDDIIINKSSQDSSFTYIQIIDITGCVYQSYRLYENKIVKVDKIKTIGKRTNKQPIIITRKFNDFEKMIIYIDDALNSGEIRF